MEKLNKDEIFLIGIELDFKSLINLSLVNKKLYSLCKNDMLWGHLLKRDFSFNYEYEKNANFKIVKDYYLFFLKNPFFYKNLLEALRLKSEILINFIITFPFEKNDDEDIIEIALDYGFRFSFSDNEEILKFFILQCCIEENNCFRKLTTLEKKVAKYLDIYGETKEEDPIIIENIGKLVCTEKVKYKNE